MKILCPKCSAENDTENAVAGAIQCQCGEWFQEPRQPGFTHGGFSRMPPAEKSRPINAGSIIWPIVLGIVVVIGVIGIVPIIITAFAALFAILGSIISVLRCYSPRK